MAALIKLPARMGLRYLGLLPIHVASEYVKPTADNLGLKLTAHKAVLLSGDGAGEEVTEVKANQWVKIKPSVPVSPVKYTLLLGFNPALAELGTVSCPNILPPGSGDNVFLTIKAQKSFKLEDLDYIFTAYMVD